jgi:hypothetical protein
MGEREILYTERSKLKLPCYDFLESVPLAPKPKQVSSLFVDLAPRPRTRCGADSQNQTPTILLCKTESLFRILLSCGEVSFEDWGGESCKQ